MTTFIRYSSFILISVFILTACEKKKETVDLSGSYIKVNDDAYLITDALIENFGKIGNQDIFEIHLSIYSDIVATGKEGKVTTLSGTGNVLFLKIYSSSEDSLITGVHELNYSNNLGSYKDPIYIINWNTQDKQIKWTRIVSGEVRVSKNDDYYNIVFDGVDENGAKIDVVFKGILKYFY